MSGWVNPFADPVFEPGDAVTCVNAEGIYRLTEGNTYKVLAYDAEERVDGNVFTWPAYVRIYTGRDKTVWCHAVRFRKA